MNPNSRDNVNERATVIIKAYDRNGDVVDQHEDYGRHEPATQLLDFMLNCEAMWGKMGTKIVRFTCEIAYILLVGLIFLSSSRVEASHGDPSHQICCGMYSSISTDLPVHHTRILVSTARPSHPFPDQAAPVLYVIKWPPVKSEAQRLAEQAYERLVVVFKEPQPVSEFRWRKFWEYTVYSATGLAAALCGILYLILRRAN